jgi:hypothetical protein
LDEGGGGGTETPPVLSVSLCIITLEYGCHTVPPSSMT